MQNIRMRVQMSFDPRLDRYPACLLLCEEMNGKDLTETKLLRFIKGLCPAQQALLRMLPSRASTTWTRRCLRPDMCGTRCVCRKTEMFRFYVSNDVHTLRTPPTANWLKGGVWATKTCTKKHLLRSSYRLRQVPIKKEKVSL